MMLRCLIFFPPSFGFFPPHTVDGRNPAPVEVGSLSHYLQGVIHPRWYRISSINSITKYLDKTYSSECCFPPPYQLPSFLTLSTHHREAKNSKNRCSCCKNQRKPIKECFNADANDKFPPWRGRRQPKGRDFGHSQRFV